MKRYLYSCFLRIIVTFYRSASHPNTYKDTFLRKSNESGRNLMLRYIKAELWLRKEFFECWRTRTRTRTQKRAREDSPIFPSGNRQVSPGWRASPKYCLLGELCLSRLSVCPIHFTSSVRIHLSRSHAAFPPIEVGLQRSCVPKRKCCLNNVALACSPFNSPRVCDKIPHNTSG